MPKVEFAEANYFEDSMIELEWLGQIEYEAAWALQKELVAKRTEGQIPDRLLLLEHAPVYTMGRSGSEANLLFDEARRAAEGIGLFWVDRGGDVTYHGPGQLVGYPIIQLRELHQRQGRERLDLHLYLRQLEELIILTLADFGVQGWRYEGYTGVWVTTGAGPRKIAAIGIKVSSKGVTSHGFALNVDPNMTHFSGIVPCGIEEHGVISLAELLDRPVTIAEVIPALTAKLPALFASETSWLVQPSLST